MERIELSKKQRAIYNAIAREEYPNVCNKEDIEDIIVLREKGLVRGINVISGDIVAVRLTDQGRAYLHQNPKLKNPSVWQDKKYIINTAISLVALVVSIIALIKK